MIRAIVVDSGSDTCRAGWAGHTRPTQERYGAAVRRATQRGYVENWEAAAQVWRSVLAPLDPCKSQQKGISPKFACEGSTVPWSGLTPAPVLLSETLFNSTRNRERAAAFFFEHVGVTGFHMQCSAQLSLYTSGRTSGCVLDCGAGSSSCAPIFEGYLLPQHASRMEYGGQDVTAQVADELQKRGYATSLKSCGPTFGTLTPAQVEEIKKEHCFACKTAEKYAEMLTSELMGVAGGETEAKLPDGTHISLGAAIRFGAAEQLFCRSITAAGRTRAGSASATASSLQTAVNKASWGVYDLDGSPPHVIDLVLAGGTMRLKGLQERLAHELALPGSKKSRPGYPALRVAWSHESPELATWIGGSIIAQLDTFNNMWVSKQEYEDNGPHSLRRKCF